MPARESRKLPTGEVMKIPLYRAELKHLRDLIDEADDLNWSNKCKVGIERNKDTGKMCLVIKRMANPKDEIFTKGVENGQGNGEENDQASGSAPSYSDGSS